MVKTQQDVPNCTKGNNHNWNPGTQYWRGMTQITERPCSYCKWEKLEYDNKFDNSYFAEYQKG